jgi:hypothetical protein
MRILSSTTMSKRKRESHRRAKAARSAGKSTAALDPQVNSDAAGIDVGAEELVAAVPPGRGQGPPVRTFSAFTDGIHGLRDWLPECKIRTVAMESTGNYWLTACAVLGDAGIEVCLVVRHVRECPAKRATCAMPPGSSNCTPPVCCGQASARGARSFRCDTSCATGPRLVTDQPAGAACEGNDRDESAHPPRFQRHVDGASAQAIVAQSGRRARPRKLAALRDRRCPAPLADHLRPAWRLP